MKDSYPTSLSNHGPTGLSYLDKQVLPQQISGLHAIEQGGRWLPVILVSLYYLSLWPPPISRMSNLRWYMALGLSVLAFLLLKRRLDMKAARVYWVVYGLSFLGAALSLLRADDLRLALWNTVGSGINFVVYLLFIPVLASRMARRFLLTSLVGTAIVWGLEIQWLVEAHGTLVYSTFAETGSDKNQIGIVMALAATALFCLAAVWKPSGTMHKWQVSIMRFVLASGGIYMFYSLALVYARSSILATFVGIGGVLVVLYLRSPSRWSAVFRVGLLVSIVALSVTLLLSKVLDISPYWRVVWDRMLSDPGDAFYNREILIRKGLFLVSENPLVGVGMGGTKEAVSSIYLDFPYYYIHNSFLTDWAEKGILGLFGNLVWLYMYLKILRGRFFNSPLTDQIWLLLFAVMFFAMNFADCTSINMAMLAILSAIYYEQHHIEQPRMASIFSRNVEV